MNNNLLYIYAWLTATFFGAILSETVLLYPNIFYNVPDSLVLGMKFLKVIGPGQFFPKLGGTILLIAIITILANFRRKRVLQYLLLSFILMILFEFLFSVLYFWPRNNFMFVEGTNLHSPAELRKVANEFQLGHWIRLSISGITSCLAFAALAFSNKTGVNYQPVSSTTFNSK